MCMDQKIYYMLVCRIHVLDGFSQYQTSTTYTYVLTTYTHKISLMLLEPGVREWIQIDLHRPYRITKTATQGRYGGGNGREYAEEFVLEYWRPSLNEWKTYR